MKKILASVAPEFITRKCIRYKRSDINVYIYKKIAGPVRVQLLNISQYGLAIRSPVNLKNKAHIKLMIAFNENDQFTLKGQIVSKTSALQSLNNAINNKSANLTLPSALYDYGIDFDDEQQTREFSSFLLRSNINKRLKHHSKSD